MDVNNLFIGKHSLEEFEEDCQTIISDITDNNTVLTTDINIQTKQEELKVKIETNLNKLTLDKLKEKCKLHGHGSLSKLKKPELIGLLLETFERLVICVNNLTVNELKNKCILLNISGISKHKKNGLIMLLLTYCLDKMMFHLCVLNDEPKQPRLLVEHQERLLVEQQKEQQQKEQQQKEQQQKEQQQKEQQQKEQQQKEQQERSLVEQQQRLLVEQQQQQRLLVEQQQQQRLLVEQQQQRLLVEQQKEQQRLLVEHQERLVEQQRLLVEQQERLLVERIKNENKKKKQTMPKQIKSIIWNHYIGEDIIKHKCLCCKKVTITNTNFDVGHVISEKQGGTHEINNLRPICGACNHSMGTENMVEFVIKFGLCIG
jgi:5-methylcytosine-specific restriction endonuclease McrA